MYDVNVVTFPSTPAHVSVAETPPEGDGRETTSRLDATAVETVVGTEQSGPSHGTVNLRVVKCVIVAPGGSVMTVVAVFTVVVSSIVRVIVWSGSWTVSVVVVVM